MEQFVDKITLTLLVIVVRLVMQELFVTHPKIPCLVMPTKLSFRRQRRQRLILMSMDQVLWIPSLSHASSCLMTEPKPFCIIQVKEQQLSEVIKSLDHTLETSNTMQTLSRLSSLLTEVTLVDNS